MEKVRKNILPDWTLNRIKNVISDYQQGFASGSRDENGIIQLRMNNIDTQGNINTDSFLKVPIPDNIDNYILKENDVIFNNTNSVDLIGKTALFKNEYAPCTFSNHLTRLRVNPKKVHHKWLLYNLIYAWSLGYFNRICNRHVNQAGIKRVDIENFKFPVPPLLEQQKIVSILENFDHLIQTTQRLIETLQECKKGLIQQLFTAGIGHTEFKDTEIGNIPKEWSFKKLSDLVILNPQYKVPEQDDYAYLPMDAIDKEKMSPNYWERRTKDSLTTTKFKNGDILFAKITPSTEHGKGALIKNLKEEIGYGSTELVVLSPKEGILSDYLFYYTKRGVFRNRAVSLMEGATGRQRVPTYFFKTQLIAVPEEKEQYKISNILSNLDNKITLNHYYSDHLKQLKKGLMQVLLTGKKRVKI